MNLKNEQQIHRLGIFVFFDRDGVVDDYVTYLLNDMKENLDRLVIVVNGKLNTEGRAKLERITTDVFVRENEGLDAAGYRQGLVDYCGWDEVQKYDEVVLFNDTFYGPFYPFSEIFSDMENKDLDFWGLTEQYKTPVTVKYNKNGYFPHHIQSYFVVIRKKMTSCDEFKKYWNDMPTYSSFSEVVHNHEVMFTQHFVDKGYQCGVYVYTEDWQEHQTDNINYYAFAPHTLIHRRRYNVIKRKNFVLEQGHHLLQNGGEQLREAMEYIHTYTDYNINMVWDNLLRLYNVGELKTTMHLNYVLPDTIEMHQSDNRKKTAVFVCVRYADLFEEVREYISEIPSYIDIYVLVNCKADKDFFREFSHIRSGTVTILEVDLNQDMNTALLKECSRRANEYEYVCLLHDIKTTGRDGAFTVGDSCRYNIWNNMIKSREYIENIINTFEKNPRLGILTPPLPLHNKYFCLIGNVWRDCYHSALDLTRKMKLNCVISETVQPFTNDVILWGRTESLKPLFDWCIENNENLQASHKELGLILAYIAQHQGFYSGWVMNTNYASLQITNVQYMLGELVEIGEKGMHRNAIYYLTFRELLESCYGMVGLKGAIKAYLKKRIPHHLWIVLKHTLGRIIKI